MTIVFSQRTELNSFLTIVFTDNIIVMFSGSSILHACVIMHVRYLYIICCSSALTSSNYITLAWR